MNICDFTSQKSDFYFIDDVKKKSLSTLKNRHFIGLKFRLFSAPQTFFGLTSILLFGATNKIHKYIKIKTTSLHCTSDVIYPPPRAVDLLAELHKNSISKKNPVKRYVTVYIFSSPSPKNRLRFFRCQSSFSSQLSYIFHFFVFISQNYGQFQPKKKCHVQLYWPCIFFKKTSKLK